MSGNQMFGSRCRPSAGLSAGPVAGTPAHVLGSAHRAVRLPRRVAAGSQEDPKAMPWPRTANEVVTETCHIQGQGTQTPTCQESD